MCLCFEQLEVAAQQLLWSLAGSQKDVCVSLFVCHWFVILRVGGVPSDLFVGLRRADVVGEGKGGGSRGLTC